MSACPICKKPSDPKFRPFCSKRCSEIDLGRWLTESYAIPAETLDHDEEARPDAPPEPRPH